MSEPDNGWLPVIAALQEERNAYRATLTDIRDVATTYADLTGHGAFGAIREFARNALESAPKNAKASLESGLLVAEHTSTGDDE